MVKTDSVIPHCSLKPHVLVGMQWLSWLGVPQDSTRFPLPHPFMPDLLCLFSHQHGWKYQDAKEASDGASR